MGNARNLGSCQDCISICQFELGAIGSNTSDKVPKDLLQAALPAKCQNQASPKPAPP